MIKILILFTIFTANIFVVINANENEDNFRIELLDPRGFRHSFKPAFDVYNVTIYGIITAKTTHRLIGYYTGITELNNDGWFIYKDTKAHVNPGDTIHFWENINSLNTSHSTSIREYTIPTDAQRVSC